MINRELLALAAKAYGIDTDRCLQFHDGAFDWPGKSGRWNPRTDYGDALRLAAKLRLELRPDDDCIVVAGIGFWEEEPYGDGPEEDAWCRAIVRVAAEIGRAMPAKNA